MAYLLSPQDLAAYDLIDELVEAGVCSLKIEGRLKSPHYVAATTQTYRAALDAALGTREFVPTRQQELDLTQSFSRGFSPGFFGGNNHQQLVVGRFPKARGVRVGTVVRTVRHGVVVELDAAHEASIVKPGDGIVFDEGHPDQDEQGGRIYTVREADGPRRLEIGFGEGAVNLSALSPGAIVWRTDDPEMRRRMERSFNREGIVKREPVDFQLPGRIGGTLTLEVRDDGGLGRGRLARPAGGGEKHPLTKPNFANNSIDWATRRLPSARSRSMSTRRRWCRRAC